MVENWPLQWPNVDGLYWAADLVSCLELVSVTLTQEGEKVKFNGPLTISKLSSFTACIESSHRSFKFHLTSIQCPQHLHFLGPLAVDALVLNLIDTVSRLISVSNDPISHI